MLYELEVRINNDTYANKNVILNCNKTYYVKYLCKHN